MTLAVGDEVQLPSSRTGRYTSSSVSVAHRLLRMR
jgi:hypothetical protein